MSRTPRLGHLTQPDERGMQGGFTEWRYEICSVA